MWKKRNKIKPTTQLCVYACGLQIRLSEYLPQQTSPTLKTITLTYSHCFPNLRCIYVHWS